MVEEEEELPFTASRPPGPKASHILSHVQMKTVRQPRRS